jgi:hypothetical protein
MKWCVGDFDCLRRKVCSLPDSLTPLLRAGRPPLCAISAVMRGDCNSVGD